jgi:hypothetical protein
MSVRGLEDQLSALLKETGQSCHHLLRDAVDLVMRSFMRGHRLRTKVGKALSRLTILEIKRVPDRVSQSAEGDG